MGTTVLNPVVICLNTICIVDYLMRVCNVTYDSLSARN